MPLAEPASQEQPDEVDSLCGHGLCEKLKPGIVYSPLLELASSVF